MSEPYSNQIKDSPESVDTITCVSSLSNLLYRSTKPCNSLKKAAEMNHHQCIKKAMKEGLNMKPESRGSFEKDQYIRAKYAQYLFIAIGKENYETVEVFLELGIKPVMLREYQDKKRMTPLHLASRNLSVNSMRLLLDGGADINAQDDDGESCVHYIIRDGNYNEYLITSSIPNVKEKAMECLKVLLEHPEIDIDAADRKTGCTPLHLAAMQKNDLFVTELIKRYGLI